MASTRQYEKAILVSGQEGWDSCIAAIEKVRYPNMLFKSVCASAIYAAVFTVTAQASFFHALHVSPWGVDRTQTKGYVQSDAFPTVWSASPDYHQSYTKIFTTTFQGYKSNWEKSTMRVGFSKDGAEWGTYNLKQFYSSGGVRMYYVCQADRTPDFCADHKLKSYQNFAIQYLA
ncbi:hypothetical protein BGZ70_008730 [Mortierella alpina]|uniref:Uncharacterized protein n=1 Tax=Mortierella alpina TaxID=64518 RepID=A0A9P6J2U0_MORAP|nr:hypothetical protein BGZ70_008730 [Mortierella alpina]